MNKNYLLILVIVSLFLAPVRTFAAGICTSFGTPQDFRGVVCLFTDLITTALPVVAGLALVVFFWGLAKFILKAGDETARAEGKQVMVWGIIALFVLVSIWGIISFITGEIFGISTIKLPLLRSN